MEKIMSIWILLICARILSAANFQKFLNLHTPMPKWMPARSPCILCASCTAACPINRADPEYVGPAALLRTFRYIFDIRDSARDGRLADLDIDSGIWGCKTMKWCTVVCPKKIPVTKCLTRIKQVAKKQA